MKKYIGIILSGKGGSGKDVIADYLVEKHRFNKDSFGEPLKIIAKDIWGMKEKDRELLQNLGLTVRSIDPYYLKNSLIERLEPNRYTVIADCRDEIEYSIVEQGFLPIRVISDLNYRIERIEERDGIKIDAYQKELLENHQLENLLNDKEFIEINNNGTLDELYQQIDDILLNFFE